VTIKGEKSKKKDKRVVTDGRGREDQTGTASWQEKVWKGKTINVKRELRQWRSIEGEVPGNANTESHEKNGKKEKRPKRKGEE